jgi:hypothetical protein
VCQAGATHARTTHVRVHDALLQAQRQAQHAVEEPWHGGAGLDPGAFQGVEEVPPALRLWLGACVCVCGSKREGSAGRGRGRASGRGRVVEVSGRSWGCPGVKSRVPLTQMPDREDPHTCAQRGTPF